MEALQGVDAVVIAVMHKAYTEMGIEGIAGLCSGGDPIVVDVKNALDSANARSKGIVYWSL
jgi:UDP-N-acetyl-D-galactosamine dehydrogenase